MLSLALLCLFVEFLSIDLPIAILSVHCEPLRQFRRLGLLIILFVFIVYSVERTKKLGGPTRL